MARPIKQGLDYFPMDVDMDQDDKVAIIEAIHGIVGYGIIVKLLSKIYKEGYFYEWNNREQLLFSKRVNVDINTVNAIVNDCVNEGLFDKKLFDAYNILTSRGIQKRYLEAIKRRKEVTFIKKYFLIDDIESIIGNSNIKIYLVDDDGNRINVNKNSKKKINDDENEINVDINSINDNKSTQRKGKEIIKEKENKLNYNNKENNILLDDDAAVVVAFWDQNGFGFNNINAKNKLLEWLDEPQFKEGGEAGKIILKALEVASAANKRNLLYVEGILRNWLEEGCKTLTDVEAFQKQFEVKAKRVGKVKKEYRKEDFDLSDD